MHNRNVYYLCSRVKVQNSERNGALFDAMLRRTLYHELRVILDGFDFGTRNLSGENIKSGHTT
jgi:hypothetical protein